MAQDPATPRSVSASGGITTSDVAALSRPKGANPNACYETDTLPAQFETVTTTVLASPAITNPDGTIQTPARYESQTSQRMTRARQTVWVETVCPNLMTPEFIASLQRALKARGHYDAPVSGQWDLPTRAALRAFQAGIGLNVATLTTEAARQLGLIAYQRG